VNVGVVTSSRRRTRLLDKGAERQLIDIVIVIGGVDNDIASVHVRE
jgi:hypothetical protein